MKQLILAAILLGAAIMFWRPTRRIRRLGIDHLVSTGHAFLVIGCLVGLAFGPRTLPITESIGPLVAFISGWVGFAAGMRFDRSPLRAVPAHAFAVALAPGLAALLGVGGIGAGVLYAVGTPLAHSLAAGLVLGAAAASSGPTLAAALRSRRAGRSAQARATLRMIEFSAIVDDVIVLVVALGAFAVFRPREQLLSSPWLLLLGALGGVVLGVVLWLFLGGRAREDERMLLGLAMLAFIAGFAGWLDFSPAAVAAIAGITLVNMPGERAARLVMVVRRVERTAVVILMIVIGVHVAGVRSWVAVPLVFAMTAVRFGAKHAAGEALSRPIPRAPGLAASSRWAYGLAPQGTLGLVVALGFFHVYNDAVSLAVLAAVAAASLVNELVSPWLLLSLIRRTTAPHRAAASREAAPA